MSTTKKGKAVPKKKRLPSKKKLPLKKAAAPKRKKTSAVKPGIRSKPAKKAVPGIVSFSDTQLAIIRMICNQLTSKEISKKLKLTKRTVEDYRGIIQDKMGVLNVAGLVVYAIKHGIYEVE